MTARDQQRAHILARLIAGEVDVGTAATLIGVSERQVWRLRRAFLERGPEGLVHANRGRPSGRRLAGELRGRVVELASGRYDEANDCHLTELLAEREGITLSRVTVRRILRAAGVATPRRRRPARDRSRRDRMPQAGLLLQLDGSRHDWLEGRGPWLTLVGAIDDATGTITAATFRDQEDSAEYFEILRATIRRHGLPAAVYREIGTAPSSTPNRSRSRVAPRRRTGADPGRASPRGARHPLDRRRFAPGQRPRRASLGDLPGPPRDRAPPGRCGRPGERQPGPRPLPCSLQPALHGRAGEPGARLAPRGARTTGPGKSGPQSFSVASAATQGATRTRREPHD
jgi:transposase